MYWEGTTRFEKRRDGPPFRRAMDIDTMVLSDASEWDDVLSDSQKIIHHAIFLLAQDNFLRTLQMQMLPILHAQGVLLTHSPIFSVRSSPTFFKQDAETGKSVLDYERMYHTIMMNVHPFLLASQKQCCFTLFEMHVKPRCNWNVDHLSLSRAVLGKFMEVTKIQTSKEMEASEEVGIWIPNDTQMVEHANKVIGNRKPHQAMTRIIWRPLYALPLAHVLLVTVFARILCPLSELSTDKNLGRQDAN